MHPKIDFHLFGLHLVGPNNFVTSHLIVVAGFTVAFLLWKEASSRSPQQTQGVGEGQRYWVWFLFLLGLQATVSAFGHLGKYYGGDYLLLLSFFINTPLMYLLGMALLSEMEAISETARRRWKWFFIVQAVVYTLAVPLVHHFWVSISNAAVSLFTILPANIAYWYRQKRMDVFLPRLGAELATVGAGLVYGFHVHLADWFDKDDFGHVFVVLSIVCFYLSIRAVGKEKRISGPARLRTDLSQ